MSRLSYNDRVHRYELDGKRVPSVTTILGVLNKPGMVWSAAQIAGTWGAIHARELLEGAETEVAWIRQATTAHQAEWKVSRDNGTMLHTLVQALIVDEPLPAVVTIDGEEVPIPDRVHDMAAQAVKLMDAWNVEPVLVEAALYHERFGYAGRLDLVADIAGERWLLDWKTAKGVYPENTLQLNAYGSATHYVDADGVDHPIESLGITRAGVAWIQPDRWELIPVDYDPQQFGVFLHALSIYQWTKAPKGRHVHEPLDHPEVTP